jgi:hypothetical protein
LIPLSFSIGIGGIRVSWSTVFIIEIRFLVLRRDRALKARQEPAKSLMIKDQARELMSSASTIHHLPTTAPSEVTSGLS